MENERREQRKFNFLKENGTSTTKFSENGKHRLYSIYQNEAYKSILLQIRVEDTTPNFCNNM